VLCEWERTSEESGTNKLFAFFNCGNESGASQSHRHIQFLPNASMQNGLDTIDSSKARWENLTNIVAEQGPKGTLPELPFAYFGNNIPPEADEDDFYQVYVSLIEKAGQAIRDTKVVWTQHGTPYSYNLAMTTSAMILCPRRHESKPVLTADGLPPRGSEGDLANWNVALNGTILAGTLMVKDKELFEYFKGDKDGAIDRVLSGVCFPFEYAKKVQKASESDTTKL
jgi:ATP adenylyltransferase